MMPLKCLTLEEYYNECYKINKWRRELGWREKAARNYSSDECIVGPLAGPPGGWQLINKVHIQCYDCISSLLHVTPSKLVEIDPERAMALWFLDDFYGIYYVKSALYDDSKGAWQNFFENVT